MKRANKHVHIEFKQGLMAEHIMASASVPVHYDYAIVPETYDYNKSESEMRIRNNELRTRRLIESFGMGEY